jgi:hypothetical protein
LSDLGRQSASHIVVSENLPDSWATSRLANLVRGDTIVILHDEHPGIQFADRSWADCGVHGILQGGSLHPTHWVNPASAASSIGSVAETR